MKSYLISYFSKLVQETVPKISCTLTRNFNFFSFFLIFISRNLKKHDISKTQNTWKKTQKLKIKIYNKNSFQKRYEADKSLSKNNGHVWLFISPFLSPLYPFYAKDTLVSIVHTLYTFHFRYTHAESCFLVSLLVYIYIYSYLQKII